MNRVILLLFASLWTVGSSITVEDCPSGLKRDKHLAVFQNKCYYFHLDMKKKFDPAQEVCQQNGGNLASIKTSAINDFVWKQIRNELYYQGQIWIGLSDRQSEGNYKWQDGSALNFDHFEPYTGPHTVFFDNSRIFEDCIVMNAWDGKWMDMTCNKHLPYNDKHSFVCDYDVQKKPDITTPIPTTKSTIISTLRSQSTPIKTGTTATAAIDIANGITTSLKSTPKLTTIAITETIKPSSTTSHTSQTRKETPKPSSAKQTPESTHLPPLTTPTVTIQHSSIRFTKNTTPSPSAYTSSMSKDTTKQTPESTHLPPLTTPTVTIQHSSSRFTKNTTPSPSAYTSSMSKDTTKQTPKSTHLPPLTNPTVTIQHSSSRFPKGTTPSPSTPQSSSDLLKDTTTSVPPQCPPCDLVNMNCGPKGMTIDLVGTCIVCKCRT